MLLRVRSRSSLTCHRSLFATGSSFGISNALAVDSCGLLRHLRKIDRRLIQTDLRFYEIKEEPPRKRSSFCLLLAQAATGVNPFEASGQNVTNIAEVEEEERHSYYRVHYSHDFAPFRLGINVAVTCAVNENMAK